MCIDRLCVIFVVQISGQYNCNKKPICMFVLLPSSKTSWVKQSIFQRDVKMRETGY